MRYSFRTIFWIFLILAGILMRCYRFGSVPVTLNRDEAALGYNAFSIAKFGMDEWGKPWPLTFKSFGDYKLPGYIYLDAFVVEVFGVHDWSVRLPSFLAGLGMIAVTYFLINRWFEDRNVALISAALLAIEPWSVFYSRMAYEANLALFLLLLSLLLFSFNKWYWWAVSLCTYALSVLTYNTPLILIPLIGIFLFLKPGFTIIRRIVIISGLIFIGIYGVFLLQTVTIQKQNITIFSDPTMVNYEATQYSAAHGLIQRLYWNKEFYYVRESVSRWIQSWSPAFLVIRGGANPWHSVPQGAHFYWIVYLALFLGLVKLIQEPHGAWRQKLALILLLAGSLLPSIVTVDSPHATRSLFFFWLITILSGYGISFLNKQLMILAGFVLCVELTLFNHKYFVLFPEYRSPAWPVGLRETLNATSNDYQAGKKINIEGNGADLVSDQVYIYSLLYWHVSPIDYQVSVRANLPNVAKMNQITGFRNVSFITYNQDDTDRIIERLTDGSYRLK